MHYKVTRRDDSPFWKYCREMPIPDELARRIELFKTNGRVIREREEMFAETNWLQVLTGQGIMPRACHPLAASLPPAELAAYLDGTGAAIGRCVAAMPAHAAFIARHCTMAGRPR